jgi:hypothetical protein
VRARLRPPAFPFPIPSRCAVGQARPLAIIPHQSVLLVQSPRLLLALLSQFRKEFREQRGRLTTDL